MARLLDELGADHRNMARLLDLLEDEFAIFDRGETPDYALIAAVVDYCRAYPDRDHHPKEDAIVALMRERTPEAAQGLEALEREHVELSRLTGRFAEIAEQVMQDLEVPRDALARTAREFIAAYRRHIDWEDEVVFPRAREALGEADWEAVAARLQSAEDPLFGGDGEARFRALRRALLGAD